MQTPIILSTLLMGVVGAPHCVAMCGAACSGITQNAKGSSLWQFQLGRLIGYSSLGALAASSVNGLAWFTRHTAALHPVWTFFHVLVFAWGLILITMARQPIWVEEMGRNIWQKTRRLSQVKFGVLFTGMLWAFMPCGLLYSALLVAALTASPTTGALAMCSFAIGGSLGLFVGPWLWRKIQTGKFWLTETRGMRIAGLLLTCVAAFAIWMDLTHPNHLFCVS